MQKITLLSISMIALFAILSSSCKKKAECVGGSGGNVSVKTSLAHHGRSIPGFATYRDTVYAKFNSQDYPSNGLAGFDTKVIGDSGKDYVIFNGLQCGNYYFYAVGGDTVWVSGSTTPVRGGLPFTTDQTSGQLSVTIPVSE